MSVLVFERSLEELAKIVMNIVCFGNTTGKPGKPWDHSRQREDGEAKLERTFTTIMEEAGLSASKVKIWSKLR